MMSGFDPIAYIYIPAAFFVANAVVSFAIVWISGRFS